MFYMSSGNICVTYIDQVPFVQNCKVYTVKAENFLAVELSYFVILNKFLWEFKFNVLKSTLSQVLQMISMKIRLMVISHIS